MTDLETPSCFSMGVISAKKSRKRGDFTIPRDTTGNPFDQDSDRWTWWNNGWDAAHNDIYIDDEDKLLVDKPVYEKGHEIIE